MELNIDQTMSDILEWDFSLVHNNRSVATRPLTLGDLGRLVAMSSKGKPASSAGDSVTRPAEIFKSLLAESGPEIDEWVNGFRGEEVYAALNAIAKYSGWAMSKNSLAIDPAIERAMAILLKPSGTSTPA